VQADDLHPCEYYYCLLSQEDLATDFNVIEGHREFCVYTKKLASECSDKYRIKGKEF
jgi:hypothetical protein